MTEPKTLLPTVNGVPIAMPGEVPDAESLRQRAYCELLRQAAVQAGLLGDGAAAREAGAPSRRVAAAIERLLDQEIRVPEPDDAACRRHHAAHRGAYRRGERVLLRHLLFAVTPGVDLRALRRRAEQVLLELRCDATSALFAERAATLSNCPSGADGGQLGWLQASDCAPEFAREIFGHTEVGVLPRLVHSRFGLHLVEVLQRDAGVDPPYEAVSDAVRQTLRQRSWATALRQYLSLLVGQAELRGVVLHGSDTPLVQQ